MKRKYLLFAFILSFFIFNLVHAEELYNLGFKTKSVAEKSIINTYYNNGYLTADLNNEGEYTHLTTYDSKGNILKEKKLYEQEIMSVAVNNENIYALIIDYNEDPIIYLKEYDSDLKELNSVIWVQDDEYNYLIQNNYSFNNSNKYYINFHQIIIEDNKIYTLQITDSYPLIKSYTLNLTNEETQEITGNSEKDLTKKISETFPEFKYIDLVETEEQLRDDSQLLSIEHSGYKNNTYFLVGIKQEEDTVNYTPVIYLYDQELKLIKNIILDNNLSIETATITNNNLFVAIYNNDTEKSSLNIYDLQGNLVQTINNTGTISNIEETPKGIILSENTSDEEDEYLTTHNTYLLKRTITTNVISGNGTIIVPDNVTTGDLVTITINPENGYVLGEIKVTDADGNEIKVTNNTFTMPSSNITITATFIKGVINPETSDIAIASAIIIFFIAGFIIYKQSKKLKFLK